MLVSDKALSYLLSGTEYKLESQSEILNYNWIVVYSKIFYTGNYMFLKYRQRHYVNYTG